jgi:hypothetical protein
VIPLWNMLIRADLTPETTESGESEESNYQSVKIFTQDLKDIHAKETLQQVFKVKHDQDLEDSITSVISISINHDYETDS